MNQRGYTVLDLMMTVCIIGVLAMVAMTEYNKIHNRAYVGSALADIQVFRQALAMYDAEWGVFPAQATNDLPTLVDMLQDPLGQPYISAPTGHNFEAFAYDPPEMADIYGDYSLTVICKDHYRTQVTVHGSEQIDKIRLN